MFFIPEPCGRNIVNNWIFLNILRNILAFILNRGTNSKLCANNILLCLFFLFIFYFLIFMHFGMAELSFGVSCEGIYNENMLIKN